MPEDKKTVDIDTSGPGAEVDVAEEKVKDESVVETEAHGTRTRNQGRRNRNS
jgi:hypothetical protein